MSGLKEDELKQFLLEASKLVSISSGKPSVRGKDNVSKYNDIVEIILDGTDIVGAFRNVRHSKSFTRNYLKFNIIPSLKSKKSFSKTDFNNEIKKYLSSKKPLDTFHFIFPLNFDLRKKTLKKKYTVFGNEIQILNYKEFKKSKYFKESTLKRIELSFNKKESWTKYKYALVKFESRDVQFAGEESYEIISRFLALVNLGKFYRMEVNFFGFGSEIQSTSKIKSPPFFFVYDKKKRFVNYMHSDDISYEEFVILEDGYYSRFLHFYNKVSKLSAESELYSIISKCLSLYQRAISRKYVEISFLEYWRMLEVATLIEKEKYTEMVNRIRSIYVNLPETLEKRISDIRIKRNAYIHKDILNIHRIDLNLIKILSETMLDFLINHCNKYTKDEIKAIYQNGWKTIETLKRKREILSYLIREKTKPRP